MKTYFMRVKRAFFLVGIVAISVVFYIQYPKLNIIAGYAAKNMSTNVFYANRSEKNVQNKDHNVPSVKLAKTTVDANLKTATSSVFGALKRTSFFREGLGSVLIDDEFDIDQKFLTPKRTPNTYTLPYPYGTGTPSDSTFANIDRKSVV